MNQIPDDLPIHQIIDRVLPTLSFNKEYINKKVDKALKELSIQVYIPTTHHIIERMKKFGLVEYEVDNFLSVYGCISDEGDRIKKSGGWIKFLNDLAEAERKGT